MGKGMAEIELAPLPRLVRVARDDARLHGCRSKDKFLPISTIGRKPLNCTGIVVVLVFDDEGLQQFRGAGQEVAARQRAQRLRADVGEHRLDNHAQHVLVRIEIHPGLPADGGIDLGQERRGHIGIPHAALVDGSGEAREIRGNPAAYGKHERLARRASLQQRPGDEEHRLHRLLLLRRLDGDTSPNAGHGRNHLRGYPGSVLVVHDEHFRLRGQQRRDPGDAGSADHAAGGDPVDGDDDLLRHRLQRYSENFAITRF